MKEFSGPFVPLVLVATLLAASNAAAQGKTYKCSIDGRTVFQQTACPVNHSEDGASSPAEAGSAASRAHARAKHATPAAGAASGSLMHASAPGG
jgi:hypothetical protein